MVANIRGYTPNYNFKLVNFDTPRWHTLEYANWAAVDSLLSLAGIPHIRGEWLNSTLYLVGDRTIDPQTGDIYRCVVEHTSAATGTFEADRLARPTLWVLQVGSVPLFRGDWTPNTTFALGDIVVVDSYTYYLCSTEHTSSATFPPDVANWQLIFDASQAAEDAQAAADAAQVSATEAAASANDAATAAVSANDSKNQALNSATSASGSASSAAASESAAATSASSAATSAASAAASAANLRGTSTTPNTISLGAKTFTTQAGKQFDAGNFMTIVDVGNPSNVLSGQVTSYSGTTLQINITDANGIGSSSNWNLFVSGSSGIDGNPGITWKGTWSAATAYQINDAVITAAGSSYICVNPHTNSPPPSANWNLLAQGGSTSIADDSVLPQMLDADTAPKQLLMRDRLNFASRSGDTMTGHLKLPISPAADEAVRKDYVDAADTALSNSATAALALKADIASPTFTGDPKAPTPTAGDNDTSIATTAFVKNAVDTGIAAIDLTPYAPKASPVFTGNPTAPTPAPGDSDTSLATTAFVQGAIATSTTNKVDKGGDTMTGHLSLPTGPAAANAVRKDYVDTTAVAKAGDTMTGDLTIAKATPLFILDKTASGQAARIQGKLNGVLRWNMNIGNGTVESGGNVGSDFALSRYNDAGTVIDSPLTITRVDGLMQVIADPTVALGVATKQYVDGKVTAATYAEYWANSAPTKLLTSGEVWTAASTQPLTPAGSTITPNFSAGLDFITTLNAVGMTMANPTNTKSGQKGIIVLAQDGTGSRTITTWGSAYKFPGGTKPVLSTTAGANDIVSYVVYTSTIIYCTFSADFK